MDSKCLESFLIPEDIATEGIGKVILNILKLPFHTKGNQRIVTGNDVAKENKKLKDIIKSEVKNNKGVAKNYGKSMPNILNEYSNSIDSVVEPVQLAKVAVLYNKLVLIAKEFNNCTHALYSNASKDNYNKCDVLINKCINEYKKFKSNYANIKFDETHTCVLEQSSIYKINQMYNEISGIEYGIYYRIDNFSDPTGKYDDEYDTYADMLKDCDACCDDMATIINIDGLLEKCKFVLK